MIRYPEIIKHEISKFEYMLFNLFKLITNELLLNSSPSKIWKNENMNILDAYIMNQKFDKMQDVFQTDNWAISGLTFSGAVESRIVSVPNEDLALTKVKNYINKKLSL